MKTDFFFSIVLNVFFARELSERLRNHTYKSIIVNTVNPGFCHSSLTRHISGLGMWLSKLILARSSEQGSRQLIWASIGGKDNIDQLHGAYISSMQVREPSDFVISEEGRRAQTILWVNIHLSYYYRITDKHVFVARTL